MRINGSGSKFSALKLIHSLSVRVSQKIFVEHSRKRNFDKICEKIHITHVEILIKTIKVVEHARKIRDAMQPYMMIERNKNIRM